MTRVAACLALVAAGLLTVSACSSGQPAPAASKVSVSSAQPTGSPSTASPAPSPSLSTSPAGAALRVHISSAFIEEFDTPLPADPAQAKVIAGFRNAMVAWDQASVTLRVTGRQAQYVTGSALATLRKTVRAAAQDNLVQVGTDHLYDTKITSITGTKATVTTCDDGSAWNQADRTTGQTQAPVPVTQQYIFVTFYMVPLDGHWAYTDLTVTTYPDQRAKTCMQDARTGV